MTSPAKYFKIINFDGSVFTYGKSELDEKTLGLLENAFVEEKDLGLFGNEKKIVEVIVEPDDNVMVNEFPDIHPCILWLPKLTLVDEKKEVNKLNSRFIQILDKFSICHNAFIPVSLGDYQYIAFEPKTFLENEIVSLQKQLSEHMKNNNDNRAQLVSTEYFDRSEHLDENIQRAYLKIHKLLKEFRTEIGYEKLVLKDDHRLAFTTGIFSETDYQTYLCVLDILLDYLAEHPITI